MSRDEDARANRYTAVSYLQVLEDQLPTIYEPSHLFMQDNTRIHIAKVIIEYFKTYSIELLKWPPYSLDLNPIEHSGAS